MQTTSAKGGAFFCDITMRSQIRAFNDQAIGYKLRNVIFLDINLTRWREVSTAEAQELIEHARKYEKLALVHANKGTDLGFV